SGGIKRMPHSDWRIIILPVPRSPAESVLWRGACSSALQERLRRSTADYVELQRLCPWAYVPFPFPSSPWSREPRSAWVSPSGHARSRRTTQHPSPAERASSNRRGAAVGVQGTAQSRGCAEKPEIAAARARGQ